LALLAGLVSAGAGGDGGALPAGAVRVTVLDRAYGPPVPSGFLGLSLEFSAVESYAGRDPAATNPVFVRLVRNLAPGQRPVLRIGGDSADWTWWPVPGIARRPGVTFALSERWMAVTRALTRALGARLILGLNFEADSAPVAAAEAQALLSRLGPSSVWAFELGNEPTLYSTFPWYRTASGRGVPGRPLSYDFDAFLADFARIAAQLPAHPLAGPSLGGPGWFRYLERFVRAVPALRILTVHRYPLQLCLTARGSARYSTLAHLLSPAASTGFAQQFAPAVAVAHAHGLPLRIDELNSVSCGADRAVGQSFASALWAADTLFELLRVGADGVQVHTFPGAGYELFRFARRRGRWSAVVAPEYYGLLLFAAAAPPGARLLAVTSAGGGPVKVWATAARDRRLRVLVLNEDLSRAHTVALRLPDTDSPATLERLTGSTPGAGARVTLGGLSFGTATASGRLTGTPASAALSPRDAAYVVALPPASAALLSVALAPGAAARLGG
ncbi:MAG TPA: glycosyl hydrolase family 79 C-terminal domain-containing protein, partial [Solirubrobacteraceae bacterium]|nr:glycosyl hydrolase family 79 C-terminal domain-containing protein [Solirubrobacteraceae bacterium]